MVEYKEVWDPDYVVWGWICVLEDIMPPWKCMTGEGVKGDGMKTQCYYYYEEVVQYIVVWLVQSRERNSPQYISPNTQPQLYTLKQKLSRGRDGHLSPVKPSLETVKLTYLDNTWAARSPFQAFGPVSQDTHR